MTAYTYITGSLLLYPIVGWLIMRACCKTSAKHRKLIIGLCILSILLIVGSTVAHIITISQNLNWFLLTSIYLTISILLWLTQLQLKEENKIGGKILMIVIFGTGYFIMTFGFLFVIFASSDWDTDQRRWLTDNLIYKERNIGQGPDPSIRLKEIEVYRTLDWFPVLAFRIKSKTYDTWKAPLRQYLNVSYSKENQILYLKDGREDNNSIKWRDTLSLDEKYFR